MIVVCVSLTAFVFFTAAAAVVVVIVATVTVAVAVVVICCHPQQHPHARTIVNLAASFPLCHDNDIIGQHTKGIDERQQEAMHSNWSNIHSLRVGLRNLPMLHVGWRTFFSSCAVVLCQFLVLAGNAGTRSTLFSGGLFWDRGGNSFWCYVRT